MAEISFDEHAQLGYILEGDLRQDGEGWFIRSPDGTKEYLQDILQQYANKEVRLTVVDLKEAQYLQQTLQGQYDDDGQVGEDN